MKLLRDLVPPPRLLGLIVGAWLGAWALAASAQSLPAGWQRLDGPRLPQVGQHKRHFPHLSAVHQPADHRRHQGCVKKKWMKWQKK